MGMQVDGNLITFSSPNILSSSSSAATLSDSVAKRDTRDDKVKSYIGGHSSSWNKTRLLFYFAGKKLISNQQQQPPLPPTMER